MDVCKWVDGEMVPAWTSMRELADRAGYLPPGDVETVTLARMAAVERNRLADAQ